MKVSGVRKRSLEELLMLQDDLDRRLVANEIEMSEYESLWQEALKASGWSQVEYETGVDRRWDRLGALRCQHFLKRLVSIIGSKLLKRLP